MILRRNPNAHPLHRLRGEMEDLFTQLWNGSPLEVAFGPVGDRAAPAMNIWETEESLFIESELPGMTMNDIEIFVAGNELTLKGERKETDVEGATYHRRERAGLAFSRVLRLPGEFDANRVGATLKDGVLTITLPRAEAAKPRKIEVQA